MQSTEWLGCRTADTAACRPLFPSGSAADQAQAPVPGPPAPARGKRARQGGHAAPGGAGALLAEGGAAFLAETLLSLFVL